METVPKSTPLGMNVKVGVILKSSKWITSEYGNYFGARVCEPFTQILLFNLFRANEKYIGGGN